METMDRQTEQEVEFNRLAFLESFTQYELTEDAETDFRGFARHGKEVDKDILEKRLSVLIHTANSKTDLPNNKRRYQFAGFVMLTNEESQSIDVCYWIKRKLEVTKDMSEALKNKYNTIGLDETGFALLGAD